MKRILAAAAALFALVGLAFANDFYTPSGVPSTGAPLVSSTIRNEFANIGTGFNKLPALVGNGNQVVIVNAGGTGLTVVAATALPNMVIGTNLEAWSAQLDSLAALATNGMLARTAANTITARTIAGTASQITVSNGDGVAGAPTISLPSSLNFTGFTISAGTYSSPTINTATMTAPALGTPASGVMTNVTGTAAGLTAGNVTTNANLTGPITSTGNATAVAAQTGTGSTFVMQASPAITSPTLTTPALGVATATTINKVTITAPASAATLTIPDGTTATLQGTDTYLGRSTTDQGANRVKNKDLEADSLKIVNSADTTKKIAFDPSGASTSTTTTLALPLTASRTITFPDATDTLVNLASAQTLLNKTHTNPANTDQTLTDAATVAWDMNSGSIATLTFTAGVGNTRAMGAPSNLKKGTYVLHLIQDGTGSRAMTWNAVFKWPSATAPTLSTGASKRDILVFISDGTNLYGPPAPWLDER